MATINLTYGVYEVPSARPGQTLRCRYKRGGVTVVSTSYGKTRWPYYRPSAFGGKLLPVVTDGLVEAIKRESVQTIVKVWDVSRYTVRRWRRKFKVNRFNEGTTGLWRHLAARKLPKEARRRGAKLAAKARRGGSKSKV